MSRSRAVDDSATDTLTVRPPLQNRSREAWTKVLDAGVALLCERGYDEFTIAALCERAGVPPRAIYDRVDTKDGLFLAVYEHAMAALRAEGAIFTDEQRWQGRSTENIVVEAVAELIAIFDRHHDVLHAVVLISGAHPEVNRRGSMYSTELGHGFCGLLLRAEAGGAQPDPELAVRTAFNSIYSTLVVRAAYGSSFATPEIGDDELRRTLTAMATSYLLAR